QFKTINDELGHSVGDTVLQHVARTLSESIRNNDVVSRIGGEEFLVLAERTDLKVGTAIAEKLRGKIERMGIRELNHGITSSFGVAVCQRFDQLNQTIELADQRMYEAKKQGRNCVVGGLNTQFQRRLFAAPARALAAVFQDDANSFQ
ncbi:MAG: diguanylate cyclase (GGDEF)-like protein, partial [Paracoccaceae bacterium]